MEEVEGNKVVTGPSGRHQCQGHRPKSKGTVKAKEGPIYAIANSLDSSLSLWHRDYSGA